MLRLSICSALSLVYGAALCQRSQVLPEILVSQALHGAVVVAVRNQDAGAILRYTLDGSDPGSQSPRYDGPLLITHAVRLKVAAVDGAIAMREINPHVRPGALVWNEEFGRDGAPDSQTWSYDLGNSGFGNKELETYCSPGSSQAPCDPSLPNAYQKDGLLHLVARQAGDGVFTSARLKTQGHLGFQYGRVEARVKMPEEKGLWPAFWALGANIEQVGWPASGEEDIMEHVDAPAPDWVAASLHGTHGDLTQHYPGVSGKAFDGRGWHTYGMIWKKGSVAFYVDSPRNVYARWTPESLRSQSGGVWPFDSGPFFLLLNLAVGGNWPGSPDATTRLPAEMLVDWVRIYDVE